MDDFNYDLTDEYGNPVDPNLVITEEEARRLQAELTSILAGAGYGNINPNPNISQPEITRAALPLQPSLTQPDSTTPEGSPEPPYRDGDNTQQRWEEHLNRSIIRQPQLTNSQNILQAQNGLPQSYGPPSFHPVIQPQAGPPIYQPRVPESQYLHQASSGFPQLNGPLPLLSGMQSQVGTATSQFRISNNPSLHQSQNGSSQIYGLPLLYPGMQAQYGAPSVTANGQPMSTSSYGGNSSHQTTGVQQLEQPLQRNTTQGASTGPLFSLQFAAPVTPANYGQIVPAAPTTIATDPTPAAAPAIPTRVTRSGLVVGLAPRQNGQQIRTDVPPPLDPNRNVDMPNAGDWHHSELPAIAIGNGLYQPIYCPVCGGNASWVRGPRNGNDRLEFYNGGKPLQEHIYNAHVMKPVDRNGVELDKWSAGRTNFAWLVALQTVPPLTRDQLDGLQAVRANSSRHPDVTFELEEGKRRAQNQVVFDDDNQDDEEEEDEEDEEDEEEEEDEEDEEDED
ncbi:hypothetical protein BT63DRAFT_443155 [Microthyrium microscopicum]|uniref:Uncharacterized protein n=1 Tax=Microthyrium microscopicum TaxID=703497 RepID=A0A6A6U3K4_9PEZI|nr:hypothetical protein BT63DRAFT_443155 [Microthyrium microscopicum]